MLCVNMLVELWNSLMMNRTYSELVKLPTFEERFEYLKLDGAVGSSTFGFDRYINQSFYMSQFWQDVRRDVIIRDNGCDLGIPGYEIHLGPVVHHMNPMSMEDILHKETWILDPEFLILTSHRTHNDIHFGSGSSYPKVVTERTPRDTKLW